MADNKLGSMPVGRLLISMSLPMMISFFIQAMYNIIDSMFVAMISENALTAVSLAFPMQQIMTATSVGIGVGMNANISRYLGMGDRERTARTAVTGVFMGLGFSLLFSLLGITVSRAVFAGQTDVEEIVNYGTSYLTICWGVSFGVYFGQIFEKMLVSSGISLLAMLSMASGAVFNIIFDPLLIFGVGPFPEMGIAGAAWATVLGQVLAAVVALLLNIFRNPAIKISRSEVCFSGSIAKEILGVGIPSMITIGLSSVTGYCINQVLLTYSTTATAVYGIWMKLQNFCFMPLFGMNNGMVPILSYNHARKKDNRVKQAIRLGLVADISLMLLLMIILECFPGGILQMFSAGENMMEIGYRALRILILSLPLGGTCIILSSTMQALQHSRYTLIINILRQFVLIVFLFNLISLVTHDLGMVWFAVPVSEGLACLAAVFLERKMLRELNL